MYTTIALDTVVFWKYISYLDIYHNTFLYDYIAITNILLSLYLCMHIYIYTCTPSLPFAYIRY